jgi:hypothetical protein
MSYYCMPNMANGVLPATQDGGRVSVSGAILQGDPNTCLRSGLRGCLAHARNLRAQSCRELLFHRSCACRVPCRPPSQKRK